MWGLMRVGWGRRDVPEALKLERESSHQSQPLAWNTHESRGRGWRGLPKPILQPTAGDVRRGGRADGEAPGGTRRLEGEG